LQEIAPEFAATLRYNREWQGAVELLHDGESAAIFAVYLNLFLTVIPPNYWAHLFGKGSFVVFVEVVLILIGALLGGAGAAARIAVISARLARLGTKAAQSSRYIDKAMKALKAVTRALDSFQEAANDLARLRKKLLKSRRAKTRRGKTRTTIKERRETERRDGRCRVCGSRNHHTPLHRRGNVDYR
jgi:DNA repair exonuclease SbcCD ATPase subunit